MPGDFGDSTTGRSTWEGSVDPLAPSVSNGGITPEQWEEYQRKRKRDAWIGIATTVAGMLGAQPLANAIGIGSGAGALANSAGSLPAISGGSPWAVSPYVAPAVASGTGAAGAGATVAAGAGATGAGAGMFGGMSAKDLISLGTAGAGVAGAAIQDKPSTTPTSATTDPQMQMVLELMANRLKKSEPAFDSAQAMANGLLPTQYQNGGRGRG